MDLSILLCLSIKPRGWKDELCALGCCRDWLPLPGSEVSFREQIFLTPLQPCHEFTAPLLLCGQPRLALTLPEGGIIDVLWIENRHGQE